MSEELDLLLEQREFLLKHKKYIDGNDILYRFYENPNEETSKAVYETYKNSPLKYALPLAALLAIEKVYRDDRIAEILEENERIEEYIIKNSKYRIKRYLAETLYRLKRGEYKKATEVASKLPLDHVDAASMLLDYVSKLPISLEELMKFYTRKKVLKSAIKRANREMKLRNAEILLEIDPKAFENLDEIIIGNPENVRKALEILREKRGSYERLPDPIKLIAKKAFILYLSSSVKITIGPTLRSEALRKIGMEDEEEKCLHVSYDESLFEFAKLYIDGFFEAAKKIFLRSLYYKYKSYLLCCKDRYKLFKRLLAGENTRKFIEFVRELDEEYSNNVRKVADRLLIIFSADEDFLKFSDFKRLYELAKPLSEDEFKILVEYKSLLAGVADKLFDEIMADVFYKDAHKLTPEEIEEMYPIFSYFFSLVEPIDPRELPRVRLALELRSKNPLDNPRDVEEFLNKFAERFRSPGMKTLRHAYRLYLKFLKSEDASSDLEALNELLKDDENRIPELNYLGVLRRALDEEPQKRKLEKLRENTREPIYAYLLAVYSEPDEAADLAKQADEAKGTYKSPERFSLIKNFARAAAYYRASFSSDETRRVEYSLRAFDALKELPVSRVLEPFVEAVRERALSHAISSRLNARIVGIVERKPKRSEYEDPGDDEVRLYYGAASLRLGKPSGLDVLASIRSPEYVAKAERELALRKRLMGLETFSGL